MLLNARSILNKLAELHLLIKTKNPDIISISETWLSNCVDDQTLGLNGYAVFRADRADGNDPHGGVLIAVKTSLQPKFIANDSNLEILIISLQIRSTIMKVVSCYRTPAMNSNQNDLFINYLRNKIENEDR